LNFTYVNACNANLTIPSAGARPCDVRHGYLPMRPCSSVWIKPSTAWLRIRVRRWIRLPPMDVLRRIRPSLPGQGVVQWARLPRVGTCLRMLKYCKPTEASRQWSIIVVRHNCGLPNHSNVPTRAAGTSNSLQAVHVSFSVVYIACDELLGGLIHHFSMYHTNCS